MKITVDINSLNDGEVAAAAMRASIADSSGNAVASVDVDAVSAELGTIAGGSYVASVQRLDAQGAAVGAVLSCEFDAYEINEVRTVYSGAGVNVTISP